MAIHPTYRYCLRSRGAFRLLFLSGAPDFPLLRGVTGAELAGAVDELMLRGAYFAVESTIPGMCGGGDPNPCPPEAKIVLTNLKTGSSSPFALAEFLGSPPPILLSASGVVAWITDEDNPSGPGTRSVLNTITVHHAEAFLDEATPAGTLANLAVYQCSAGCAPNTVLVAWKNAGVQHYATVTP